MPITEIGFGDGRPADTAIQKLDTLPLTAFVGTEQSLSVFHVGRDL
jgi:hypothetical protein